MLHKVGINVFDDYFSSCIMNALVSIVSYYDESYKIAAYMNGYIPQFGPYDDQYFPYIGQTDEFFDMFRKFFKYEECNYDNKNYLEIIQKAIDAGEYIHIGVDLYYWNENGPTYGIEHMSHPSLIVGYDDEKSLVYALEDDLGCKVKYYIHPITYENLERSVCSEFNNFKDIMKYDYLIMKRVKEVIPFELRFDKVKENANNILKYLSEDRFVNYSVRGNDFKRIPDEYLRVHTRFENRAIANKLLFGELLKIKAIDGIIIDELVSYCDTIITNVVKSKMIFAKHQVSKLPIEPQIIEELWTNSINLEVKMWNALLSY